MNTQKKGRSRIAKERKTQLAGYENALAIIRKELGLTEDDQNIVEAIRALKSDPRQAQFKTEAAEYARISIANIREMVTALESAGDDDTKREAAEQTIHEDALSVEVRSDWLATDTLRDGKLDAKAAEYNILLTTGGPAARIIGDLDEYGQPESAHFEYQDWFQPWTVVPVIREDEETLLAYARCFWFGE